MSQTPSDEDVSVVIDNGSGSCKAGFAGEDRPKVIFKTLVGRSLRPESTDHPLDYYVGDEAEVRREFLSLKYPISNGIVSDWGDMEKVWEYTYRKLEVGSQEYPVLLSEAPLNPKSNKEFMAQVMFEKFDVPAMFVNISSTLSYYSVGRSEGTIVEIGDGVVDVTPMCGTFTVPHAVRRQDFAGRDVTHYLQKLLQEKGYSFSTTADTDIVREMKEKSCYVSHDFCSDMNTYKRSSDSAYVLPDGNTITLGNERFRCTESLFQPSLFGHDDFLGLPELIYDAIMACDTTLRSEVAFQMLISGGTSMPPGLPERLQKDLSALFPFRLRVVAYPERKYWTWIGGSILASLSTFQPTWITRQAYDEHGPSVLHKICV